MDYVFTVKILKYVTFILGLEEQEDLILTTWGSDKREVVKIEGVLIGFQQDEEEEGFEND